MADATDSALEDKVEDAVLDLLKGNLDDSYSSPVRFPGARTGKPGTVEVVAYISGQIGEDGKGARVINDDGTQTPTGVLWGVSVEVIARHDRSTPARAWRTVEEALGYPEDMPAKLTSTALHVHRATYDAAHRKNVDGSTLECAFVFNIEAGHAC